MPSTYSTSQGDTWDLIAYRLYRNEFLMAPLLEANHDYIDMVIFPSGIALTVPPIVENVSAGSVAPWRI